MLLTFGFLLARGYSFPTDPLFEHQFDLHNKGVYGSKADEDIHVIKAWEQGVTGNGITFAILGHGCSVEHQDLAPHLLKNYNLNLDDNTTNVYPDTSYRYPGYSTGLAGIAVGASNDVCTTGIAYNANFFCVKTTVGGKVTLSEAMRHRNNESDVKLIATEHLYKHIENSEFVTFHPPTIVKSIDNVFESSEYKLPIFVSPAGGDAMSGADINCFPEVKHKSMITVSDSTPNGGRAFWSPKGSAIFVNGPSGGATTPYGSQRYEPHPPTIDYKDTDKCSSDFIPFGTGAAHVAGVITLMLEKNPDLTARDVQAILAYTSQRNDPKHPSWIRNSGGFYYSDVHGFGRVDAGRAVRMASTYSSKDFPDHVSHKTDFPEIKLSPRGGFRNSTATLNGDIKFIDHIELELDFPHPSLLSLNIISPSGTNLKASRPTSLMQETGRLRYVVRGFFGEDATGNWTVKASQEGYGLPMDVTNITLLAEGFREPPKLTEDRDAVGQDSNAVLAQPFHLKVNQTNITCGEPFEVEMPYEGAFDLFVLSDSQKFQIAADVSSRATLTLPCHMKSRKVDIYAERRSEGIGSVSSVDYFNPHEPMIIEPAPYQKIILGSKSVSFPIKFSEDNAFLGTDAEAYTFLAGIYDVDREMVIEEHPIKRTTANVSFAIDGEIERAVLFLAPMWRSLRDGCDTLLQPISILEEDKNIEKFVVNLTNHCPAPPGVVISGEEVFPADPTLRAIYVYGFIAICVVIAIAVVVWHIWFRKPMKDNDYDLNNDNLLDSKPQSGMD